MIRVMILSAFAALLYAFVSIAYDRRFFFDDPAQLAIGFAICVIGLIGILKAMNK